MMLNNGVKLITSSHTLRHRDPLQITGWGRWTLADTSCVISWRCFGCKCDLT
jgi:hypothetical protein